MIRLVFPLMDVLALAEHAIFAPRHKQLHLEHETGARAMPALWFVGDHGLYLMSNGLPGRSSGAGPDRPPDVYARGYHTAIDKHAIRQAIGGDDFVEVLALVERQPDGSALYAKLTGGAAAGATWLVFDMDHTHLELSLATGDAPL
ncbi:DUF3085 domain-containing protein [Paractinoplanes globisporus]|uniref:DUF3085 domain-containing protein n=1 Tax=Paractinoplanes globisporus TaxID=113565 RepID=A0ABW6WEX5_9ACTN|nr:DUF3085 domain-containing protein [Actinoplanes globisporus]